MQIKDADREPCRCTAVTAYFRNADLQKFEIRDAIGGMDHRQDISGFRHFVDKRDRH